MDDDCRTFRVRGANIAGLSYGSGVMRAVGGRWVPAAIVGRACGRSHPGVP